MKTRRIFTVVETHSSGETTEVVMSGFPWIPGRTMKEKTEYCREHLDYLRTTLMTQPRGFSGILGAIVTEPTKPSADFGIIFPYSGGYFNSCGDSTFSVTKALLEQGMVEIKEPITEIVLDTPACLVRVKAEVKNGIVARISFEGPPSFYQESTEINVTGIGKIPVDVAFGGLYYIFVDPREVGIKVSSNNAKELVSIGMKILDSANKQIKVTHPENPELNRIELVTFSAKPSKPNRDFRHANVYANTICVSPAGTSVSAKLAALVGKGQLNVGDSLTIESLVHPDLIMVGKAVKKTRVGKYAGVIPELSAYAYIIGVRQCIIEDGDPIGHGYELS